MKRVVAIGVQDFESLRMHGAFYVDKTDFIREWWRARDEVTLITRPRRAETGHPANIRILAEEIFSYEI